MAYAEKLAQDLYNATTHMVVDALKMTAPTAPGRSVFTGDNADEANRVSLKAAYELGEMKDGVLTLDLGGGSDAFHFGRFNAAMYMGEEAAKKIVVQMGDSGSDTDYANTGLKGDRDFFTLAGTIEDYVIDMSMASTMSAEANIVTFTDKKTGQLIEVQGAEAFVFANKVNTNGSVIDYKDDAFSFRELAKLTAGEVDAAEELAQIYIDGVIEETLVEFEAKGTVFEDITTEIAMATLDNADGDGQAMADFDFIF